MVDPDLKERDQLWVEGANVLSHKTATESLSPQPPIESKSCLLGRSDVGGAEERGRVRESGMNSNSQPASQPGNLLVTKLASKWAGVPPGQGTSQDEGGRTSTGLLALGLTK